MKRKKDRREWGYGDIIWERVKGHLAILGLAALAYVVYRVGKWVWEWLAGYL